MQVKIIGNTIMAQTDNKVITINPKQGQHHDLRAIARVELRALGYKRVTDWNNNAAEFKRVG